MKLYIVRHGETDLNVREIAQGHIDVPLNERGKKQAELLGELLEVVNFDAVYSSDLKRAVQTTKAVMKYQDCKVVYSKKIREMNYGILEGKPYADLARYYDEQLTKHPTRNRFEIRVPKGETGLQVQKRIVRFLKEVYRKHPNDTILFSTHGRLKRILVGYLQGIPLKDLQKIDRFHNCSLTIVEFDKKGHRVTLQNHVKHLRMLNRTSYAIQKNS